MTETLFRYLGTTPCNCGRCRRVGTERVHLTDDLGWATREELGGAPATLVGDPRTLAACGRALADELEDAGCNVTLVDLEGEESGPHADWESVERILKHLDASSPETMPVAVGSGTINDLVKAAARELQRAYLAVATAPSMNGYTSAIAAITWDQLKRSLPATPPVAVLASPQVLAESPRRLAVSGMADLLSKPVSSADWLLAHLLWDEPYCPVPAEIAGRAVDQAVRVADRLRENDAEASVALLEALLLSGISMTVAGSSSPASGGEHLISHYLDMTAPHAPGGPREPALHGEQVGVATRVTTRLYKLVLSRGADRIDWGRASKNAPAVDEIPELLGQAPWLSNSLTRCFAEEGSRKLKRLGQPDERVQRIRERWDVIRERLESDLLAADAYLDVLPSLEAPLSAAALGVPVEEFRFAYRLARWVRDRYTILDLVDDLGLTEELEEETLYGIV